MRRYIELLLCLNDHISKHLEVRKKPPLYIVFYMLTPFSVFKNVIKHCFLGLRYMYYFTVFLQKQTYIIVYSHNIYYCRTSTQKYP